ncbi:MAG: putative baseplate assembly protein [Spirochaetes bacterium]|nr:putative baseplate assembly protein [Spirochaetota bacterium]
MIPSPNLDDRTHKDIVEEAIRLIPHYCSEWTNHNPTDPGITLIELFAWMVEMLIYRLNRVPEKTYITLLDLIGLSYTDPQASRVLLTFTPVDQYEGEITIRRGTQASTTSSGAAGSIIFETEKPCTVKNIFLKECISTLHGGVTDNSIDKIDSNDGFLLFSGADEIERHIYIADSAFEHLKNKNAINISFRNANEIKSSTLEIINYLEWHYWNGKKWVPIEYMKTISGQRREDNEIYFNGGIDIAKTEIQGVEDFFLRASLTSIPDKAQCFEILYISSNLIFQGQGLSPDEVLFNSDNMVFNQLDISKDFYIFLDRPKYNDTLYISSNEVFSKPDAVIYIDIKLSDAANSQSDPGDNLLLKVEYWNGYNWHELGQTGVKGVMEAQGNFQFKDTTRGFAQSGRISFKRPSDFQSTVVNSRENYWIRVRIGAGDFGTGGQYKIDEEGKWIWNYDRPVKPPVLSHIGLHYEAPQKPVSKVISYYDFNFKDYSNHNIENYLELSSNEEAKVKYYPIIEVNKEDHPITYFGFDQRFPEKDFGIYFRIKEHRRTGVKRPEAAADDIIPAKQENRRNISLKWEYWNGQSWTALGINDYTDNFHESGFVNFNCPGDLENKIEFGHGLYWIRIIHEYGSFEISPRILAIHLNSIYALNRQTYLDEILGSSTGALSQEFSLLHGPLLPDIEISVKENDIPTAEEREILIAEEGEDVIQIKKGADGSEEIWIRYHQMPNFYSSTSKSRHYMVDYINNKICFGNGINGIIPPRLKNNIRASKYYTGGGTKGNVGNRTVAILRENIPYIADVNNYYPAEGGADIESLDDLKRRASRMFKNLNRAVTAEDYEWLAKEASSSVARAKCLSKTGKNGEVILIVLPNPDTDDFDLSKDIYPTSELLRRVRDYLNIRKLVGSKLKVESPSYRSITVDLKLVYRKGIAETQIAYEQIEMSLRRFLHPITGGPLGEGWEFGMPLTKNDIFTVLEGIDSVHFIEEIEIIDNDTGMPVDKLILDEDSLISVSKVNIQERKTQL